MRHISGVYYARDPLIRKKYQGPTFYGIRVARNPGKRNTESPRQETRFRPHGYGWGRVSKMRKRAGEDLAETITTCNISTWAGVFRKRDLLCIPVEATLQYINININILQVWYTIFTQPAYSNITVHRAWNTQILFSGLNVISIFNVYLFTNAYFLFR